MQHVDDSNYLIYAAKAYNNPNCIDVIEFEEDLNRIKYIKKLLKRYKDDGELRERLILNHLRILYNVFDPKACTALLIFKTWEYLEALKPFLIYLQQWDEGRIDNVKFEVGEVYGSDIPRDVYVIDRLRTIKNEEV